MAKHNANLDVRGSLRVRKRVEAELRVDHELVAAAYYIRGVGELFRFSFNPNQFYLTPDSFGHFVVNLK